MTLVTREDKGEMLTHEELDGNFTHLDTVKADLAKNNAFEGTQTFGKGIFQKTQALADGVINVSASSHFSRIVTANIAFSVTGVPPAGNVASFILDIINGGAFTVTWWANIKWPGGTPPTLTAAGRDVLGFFTTDGGATWSGMVISKDAK